MVRRRKNKLNKSNKIDGFIFFSKASFICGECKSNGRKFLCLNCFDYNLDFLKISEELK